MSDTVLNPLPNAAIILRGVSIPLASDVGGAFITDCARNREKLLSDQQICEKFGITFEALTEIGANGDAAREAAAKLFAEAPEVLGTILRNEQASPRHRIEAARELRTTANTGAEKGGDTADRVVVHINLGGDQKLIVDSGPLKQNETRNFDAE